MSAVQICHGLHEKMMARRSMAGRRVLAPDMKVRFFPRHPERKRKMLRVTVDLVPFGFENRKRNIYTLEITNIGKHGVKFTDEGEKRYSYKVRTIDEFGNRLEHGIMIKNFDRTQPAYKLINKITNKLEKKGFFDAGVG